MSLREDTCLRFNPLRNLNQISSSLPVTLPSLQYISAGHIVPPYPYRCSLLYTSHRYKFPLCSPAQFQCTCGPEPTFSGLTSTISPDSPLKRIKNSCSYSISTKLYSTQSSQIGRTSAASRRIDAHGSCSIHRCPYLVSSLERKISEKTVTACFGVTLFVLREAFGHLRLL